MGKDIELQKYQKIINRDKPLYYNLLGIEILEVNKGYAKLMMKYDLKLTNPYGFINGGFFSVLADASLACALLGMLDENTFKNLITIEYKINLIKPVREGYVTAEAKVIHMGRVIAVGEVDIKDQKDKIVAKALITYVIK